MSSSTSSKCNYLYAKKSLRELNLTRNIESSGMPNHFLSDITKQNVANGPNNKDKGNQLNPERFLP